MMIRNSSGDDMWEKLRQEFYVPSGAIYLDGNSLGLMSKRAEKALHAAIDQWKTRAIDSWGERDSGWIYMSEKVSTLTAPLIGAKTENVGAANSTTVNLHQLLATLYRPTSSKYKIVIDETAFPTDRYAVMSHLNLHGIPQEKGLTTVPVDSSGLLQLDAFERLFAPDVAIALVPSVVFTTGQLLDVERLVILAHDQDILLGVDCSHSVGAVPHSFDEWGVDFAAWCGYKYLNGGPGSSAGLYLNSAHHHLEPGLAGWFGVDKEVQFDMDIQPSFAPDASRLQIGTPNILSLAPLIGSLNVIDSVGIQAIRERSLQLTTKLIELADGFLGEFGFNVLTPREPSCRGGHVALGHKDAIRICRALKDDGVIVDFRPPNIIRLAPVALYTSLADCEVAVSKMVKIMTGKSYELFPARRELIA
jgi:kynureninase